MLPVISDKLDLFNMPNLHVFPILLGFGADQLESFSHFCKNRRVALVTHMHNDVTLVWSSFRLVPIRSKPLTFTK